MNLKTWMTAFTSLTTLATLTTGCTMATDDPDDDNGPGSSGVCTTARVFAGNPTGDIDRTMWNPAGQPAKADPPLLFWSFAGRGNQLLVNTQESLWLTDLSAADPMFRRISGDDRLTPIQYQPAGACTSMRHMAGDGLAWLPDGRAVFGDYWANGVVEMSDPTSASCTGKPVAGTNTAIARSDLPSGLLYMPGDIDGPGAQARFGGPYDATPDADGNVYVWDDGYKAVKKIAGDSARTVSKLYPLAAPLNNINAMTAFGGKLYVSGPTARGGGIVEIDTATGATRVVATDIFSEGTPGGAIAMTNDGTNLLAKTFRGYLYRITTEGVVTEIGGAGRGDNHLADLSGDLPANTVELSSPSSAVGDSLYWHDGHLYVGVTSAIFDFTCE